MEMQNCDVLKKHIKIEEVGGKAVISEVWMGQIISC